MAVLLIGIAVGGGPSSYLAFQFLPQEFGESRQAC